MDLDVIVAALGGITLYALLATAIARYYYVLGRRDGVIEGISAATPPAPHGIEEAK